MSKSQVRELFPASLEAERAVLCTLLTNASAVTDIIGSVTPADFVKPEHQELFRIAVRLFSDHKPIDMVTMTIAYRKSGTGKLSIADMFKEDFPGGYPVHIRELKELARRRRVQAVLQEAQGKIAGDGNIDETVGVTISELAQSSDQASRAPVPMRDVMVLTLKRIQLAIEKKTGAGIPTGYRKFDTVIGGLYRGDLIIVADRPAGGKSALLLGIARGAARAGFPSFIGNAEMELVDVGTRALAAESHVANFNLRRGIIEDDEFPAITAAAGRLSPLPIWIFDDNRWEVVKAQARAMKRAHPNLGVVLIDYLTRLKIKTHAQEKRYEQIGRITSEAKDLAKELQVAVVMAAQVSRSVAKEEREPELTDLRECGDIEQDADVIGFLHRFKKSKNPDTVYWLIKKNRNGPLVSQPLYWVGNDVSFYNLEDANVSD